MLQLALVHHPVPALATALQVPEIDVELDQYGRGQERTYLSEVLDRTRKSLNLPVTSILLDGPVAAALEEQVKKSETDLVVMTTHGRGVLSRFWLGSVADHLMRHATKPILAIRPAAKGEPPSTIRRVMITLDGSEFSEQAVDHALAIGTPFEAEYVLLMVVEPIVPVADPSGMMVIPVDPQAEKKRRENAQGYLERHAARLSAQGQGVASRVVEGAAAPAILAEAEAVKADLIVLASHGAGGLERALLGSVADKVVRGSDRAVLVVRPGR
jgi:nucleotide-binding universal stress UspA family protein